MDAEIAAAARSYMARVGWYVGEPPADDKSPRRSPCPGARDGYCEQYGLFVAPETCASCKSNSAQTRAEVMQLLRMAALTASRGAPQCEVRSPAVGTRKACGCDGGSREHPVFICGRSRRKVTLANCALCVARSGGS